MAAAADAGEFARDYAGIAAKYARDIVAKRVVACKWVRLAAERHLRDLKHSKANKAWGYEFVAWHAADVCDFAEKLPHIEGKWATPTITLEPWQIFGLAVVFGWRRRSDGGRRFSKVYWEVARKNAKSTLAAIVTLYCFCCEDEPAPYVFIGATTGAQAQKVFHPAKMMVKKTPDLEEAFGLKVWSKSLTEPGGGYVQTINAKGSTQDGHNPHLAVLDELHAHKDRALYDVIDSAFGARSNPLLWIITTAGFDTQGVCYEQRIFVTKVLEQIVEADHYFGLIYTLDEGDDPFNPKVWVKANPNLGVSVQIRQMEGAATEARSQPGKLGEFQTKRLNVWTTASLAHVNMDKWKRCNGPVDLEALRSVPCWMGYDLGSTSDMTSLRMIWWLDGRLKTWGLRYLPEAAVEPRTTRNSVPYARWVKQDFKGRPYLITTPDDVTDYAWIEKDIRWALEHFSVQGIGFDSWKSQDLNNRLMKDGAPLIEVRQGHASLAGPMQELDRLYLSGLLDHDGDEVLGWCASNVVARADENNNLVPSKKRSHEKIDDYAALLNAIAISLKETGSMDIGSFLANPVFG
jgi:phage terminase large subunit-like protein